MYHMLLRPVPRYVRQHLVQVVPRRQAQYRKRPGRMPPVCGRYLFVIYNDLHRLRSRQVLAHRIRGVHGLPRWQVYSLERRGSLHGLYGRYLCVIPNDLHILLHRLRIRQVLGLGSLGVHGLPRWQE